MDWNFYRMGSRCLLCSERTGVDQMNEIPENAVLVSMSNNNDHLAVFTVNGVYTEIVVCKCWLDDDGKPVTSDYYNAYLYLTPDEARALAEALLQAVPSTKDVLIDRALAEALCAIEDVSFIGNTANEGIDAQSEIETILQVFAATARRIANQEARDG